MSGVAEFLLYLVVLAIIGLGVVLVLVWQEIRKFYMELHLFSLRVDYLRREVERVSPQRSMPPPIDRNIPEFRPIPFEEMGMPQLEQDEDNAPPVVESECPPVRIPRVPRFKPRSAEPVVRREETVAGEQAWTYPYVAAPEPPREEDAAIPMDEALSAQAVEDEKRSGRLVGELGRRLLNWMLYGVEKKPDSAQLEYTLVTTWFMRAFVLFIVLTAGFLLLHGGIGGDVKVAVWMMLGIGMLVGGIKVFLQSATRIGQALLVGGFAALFHSACVAQAVYGVVSAPVAVLWIAVLAASAGVVAVKFSSAAVAGVAIAGSCVCPLVLNLVGIDTFPAYLYALAAAAGLVALTWSNRWRVLNCLGLVLSYGLFWFAAVNFGGMVGGLVFLPAIFCVHAAPLVYRTFKLRETTVPEDAAHAALNSILFAGSAGVGLMLVSGRDYLAVPPVALVLFCVGLVVLVIRGGITDRLLVNTLLFLAAGMGVWTVPALTSGAGVTVGLSVAGLLCLWLGMKLSSASLRLAAHAIFAGAFVRIYVIEMPAAYGGPAGPLTPFFDYWVGLIQRGWTFGVPVAALVTARFLQGRPSSPFPVGMPAGNDLGVHVPERPVLLAQFATAFAAIFIFAVLEAGRAFAYFEPLREPVLTALWCGAAVCMAVAHGGREGRSMAYMAMLAFISAAILKLAFIDLPTWRVGLRLFYGIDYTLTAVVARVVSFGAPIVATLLIWRRLSDRELRGNAIFGYVALVLIFVFASLEVNSFTHAVLPGFRAGGLSVLWAAVAVGCMAFGIRRNLMHFRYIGLFLFGVVIVKVLLIDLARMRTAYRVTASFAVAGLLFAAAYAYMVWGRRLAAQAPAGVEGTAQATPAAPTTPAAEAAGDAPGEGVKGGEV